MGGCYFTFGFACLSIFFLLFQFFLSLGWAMVFTDSAFRSGAVVLESLVCFWFDSNPTAFSMDALKSCLADDLAFGRTARGLTSSCFLTSFRGCLRFLFKFFLTYASIFFSEICLPSVVLINTFFFPLRICSFPSFFCIVGGV